MEATFQKTHYPDVAVVDRLAQVLNLGTERISIWFQNRRARHKKDRKQQVEQAKVVNKHQYNDPAWKPFDSKFAIDKLTAPSQPTYQAPPSQYAYNNVECYQQQQQQQHLQYSTDEGCYSGPLNYSQSRYFLLNNFIKLIFKICLLKSVLSTKLYGELLSISSFCKCK